MSYYDFFRPEAYLSVSDVYVDKVSVVNQAPPTPSSDTMFDEMVLESQLFHKIIDLFYSKPIVNKKLKTLWGT